MPKRRIPMRHIEEMLKLDQQGLSERSIGKRMGIHRRTVGRYLAQAKKAGIRYPLPEGISEEALGLVLNPVSARPVEGKRSLPQWDDIHAELRKNPHLTRYLVWTEYKEANPEGLGYSQFCERYRAWKKQGGAVMHFEHRAGEKLFTDFAGDSVPILDPTTGREQFRAQIFVAVLGASNYTSARACANQTVAAWIEGCTNAFTHMGGVSRCVVPDNAKAAVITPSRYEPVINATFLEWARHYGTTILPTRPRKPRDKAKVEGGVLIVERTILARLRHRRFFSLFELNEAIGELLAEVNAEPFQQLDGCRNSVFEEVDKPALLPLPATPYEYCEWKKFIVQLNYHVLVDHCFYSVPYKHIGVTADVRVTRTTVEVFVAGTRVASHLRARVKGKYTTVDDHMPSHHRAQAAWTPERILRWAGTVGPYTSTLCEGIMAANYVPEKGFMACQGIIRLARAYSPERVEAACHKALALRSYSYRSVASILKKGLDKEPHRHRPVAWAPAHTNIRGQEYYQTTLGLAAQPQKEAPIC